MVHKHTHLAGVRARRLKRIAWERRVSKASVIRESIDRYVGDAGMDSLEARRERALAIAGKFSLAGC